MGWFKFWTNSPEDGKPTEAKAKTDKAGAVIDLIYGLEKDKEGGKHGHIWGLGPNTNYN